MTVNDMLSKLRTEKRIEFRNEGNREICVASSTSEGIDPYLNREIIQWYPYNAQLMGKADIVIIMENESEETMVYCGDGTFERIKK